jgi:hypothetical protein
VWTWVVALNAAGFAGHSDWRVPKRRELEEILDLAVFAPAVGAAFQGASCGGACTDLTDPDCGCTKSFYYWSASTFAESPGSAWIVDFYNGDDLGVGRTFVNGYARAVRGGS